MKYLAMLALLAATAAQAHGNPTAEITTRPKPSPLMDCWNDVDAGKVECEVRK